MIGQFIDFIIKLFLYCIFISCLSLVNECVWEPYKLFEGVNASGESCGAVGVSGLGAGDTDCADRPKRK